MPRRLSSVEIASFLLGVDKSKLRALEKLHRHITTMNCTKCGKASKVSPCWKCQKEEVREEAYALGYQTGYLKGQQESPLQLTRERWEQLRRLCHPDKHDNSRASNDAFQWLQSIEPK